MFNKVLIANRGVVACRIVRTLRRLGIGSVAACSEPDRYALHAREADLCILLGGQSATDSYLAGERILQAACASATGRAAAALPTGVSGRRHAAAAAGAAIPVAQPAGIALAVCGAHMSGLELNGQLLTRRSVRL